MSLVWIDFCLQVFAVLIRSGPISSIHMVHILSYISLYAVFVGNRMDMSFVAWLRLLCFRICKNVITDATVLVEGVFWPAPLNQPATNNQLQRVSCL